MYALITFICFFFRDITIGGDIESTTFKAYLTYLYTNEIAFLDSDYKNIFGNILYLIYFNTTKIIKCIGLMKLADSYLDTGLRRKCEKVLIRRVNLGNVLFLMKNSGSANAQVKILSIS
jgi:hypothetical protein